MKIKGKRVLKNGAVAGYVWKDRKWKWRIIKGPSKKRGGGKKTCRKLEQMEQNSEWTTSRLSSFEKAYLNCCENEKDNNKIKECLDKKLNEILSNLHQSHKKKNYFSGHNRLFKVSFVDNKIKYEGFGGYKNETSEMIKKILDGWFRMEEYYKS